MYSFKYICLEDRTSPPFINIITYRFETVENSDNDSDLESDDCESDDYDSERYDSCSD